MKVYLSRSQSRAWATHEGCVGDPNGGAAYGEYNDLGTIMGGASIVGGLMQADSASDGFNAQKESAARSDATQRYFYDTTREDNAPFRNTGVAANNRLAYLLGIGGSNGGAGATAQTADQLRAQLLPQFTTGATAAIPGRMMDQGDGNYDRPTWVGPTAAKPGVVNEAGLQAAIQQAMGQQQAAQAQINDPAYGSLMRNFSAADLNADPVYQNGLQFGLNEGTKGINRMAAAGGSMLSGATLKALTKYGNDYGSTKANESFNRFNTNQDRTYNKLSNLSGAGQLATNQVTAAGQNMANNISQSQQGVGNARASSYIGGTNALVGGINQGISAWNGYNQNQMALNAPGAAFNPSVDWINNNGGGF